jgi:hypothetical protein
MISYILHMFSHICCKCFYLDVMYICNDFQVFLQVFHTHISSVSSIFFYIVTVASECFKNRSAHGYAWEAEQGASSPRRRATRATFGSASPVWSWDTGAGEQHTAGVDPYVNMGKQTGATGVRSDSGCPALAVPVSLCADGYVMWARSLLQLILWDK